MRRVVAKSSTILIGTQEETRAYRSPADVPLRLRQRLQRTLASNNTVTILIADRRGREELVKALRALPPPANPATSKPAAPPTQEIASPAKLSSLMFWLELLIPALFAGLLSAMILD